MKLSQKHKSGFTLIELTFAIAFISVLLITVSLITNEIITIYRKGYAIKTVNAVGRDLIEDLTSSIQDSPPASISSFCSRYSANSAARNACDGDHGNDGLYSVYQQFYASIKISSTETKTVPTGGIFCSGKYTYIWNTGYVAVGSHYVKGDGNSVDDLRLRIRLNDGTYFPYEKNASGTINDSRGREGDFRLVKIEDSSRAICAWSIYSEDASNSRTYFTGTPEARTLDNAGTTKGFQVTYIPVFEPVELLSDSDSDLALYDFVLFPPAQVATTNRLFYSGSFILGTLNGDVDIMTTSNFCKMPSTFNADFSYCAINKFNFSTQASGD